MECKVPTKTEKQEARTKRHQDVGEWCREVRWVRVWVVHLQAKPCMWCHYYQQPPFNVPAQLHLSDLCGNVWKLVSLHWQKNQANNYIFSIPLTKTNSKEIGFFIIQNCKERHLLNIFLCCTISFLSVFLPVLCCCHCTKIIDCKLHSVFPSDVNTGTNGCCRKFCVSIVAKEKQVRVVRLSYTWRPGTWEPRLRPEVRWCRCT